MLSCEYCKIFKNAYFEEHCERLLLYDKTIFLISLDLINYKITNRHNQCKLKFKRASRFSLGRVSGLILVSFCEFYKLKAKNKSTCTSLKKRSFGEAEAVTRSCSVKEVFLKISLNSQENTCDRVSFLMKLQ